MRTSCSRFTCIRRSNPKVLATLYDYAGERLLLLLLLVSSSSSSRMTKSNYTEYFFYFFIKCLSQQWQCGVCLTVTKSLKTDEMTWSDPTDDRGTAALGVIKQYLTWQICGLIIKSESSQAAAAAAAAPTFPGLLQHHKGRQFIVHLRGWTIVWGLFCLF